MLFCTILSTMPHSFPPFVFSILPSEKKIKTVKKKKWSDTLSHEEDMQLHQSSGNEWTPVGNSPNGLICN